MGTLTAAERQRGFEVMQGNMTAAGRVRRALKAGRPFRLVDGEIPVLQAAKRLVDEADKARSAMHKAGLDPDDIHLALAFAKPDTAEFGFKLVPAPGQIGVLITALEKIATETTVLFLGIIWDQLDRDAEAKGQPGHNVWVTQWTAGLLAETQLRALRDIVTQAN